MFTAATVQSHSNPVYAGYFADPFVWKHEEQYYAIGTGELEATGHSVGKVFSILRSTDLFHWQFAANALIQPDAKLGTHFWAPEIAVSDGTFYLYYSVGFEDKDHQLRVAVANSALGPYKDVGKSLLDPKMCAFAIDPHPFQDEDGRWYLFYARDFLDLDSERRAGTALMVAPLRSMTELAAEGKVVLRAGHDWQRFQSDRLMYGRRWDWHTLEGPCVRKHDDHYYCFYSGGRWETENYGVDYAISDDVLGPYSDEGSAAGPRVLKTVPGEVLGPGHNSIILGPDSVTDYIVYHAWDKDMTARQMCVDLLAWTENGPRCEGPTLPWNASQTVKVISNQKSVIS
jgi:beta-xylosidase